MATFVLIISILKQLKKLQVCLNIDGLIRRVTCNDLMGYNLCRV